MVWVAVVLRSSERKKIADLLSAAKHASRPALFAFLTTYYTMNSAAAAQRLVLARPPAGVALRRRNNSSQAKVCFFSVLLWETASGPTTPADFPSGFRASTYACMHVAQCFSLILRLFTPSRLNLADHWNRRRRPPQRRDDVRHHALPERVWERERLSLRPARRQGQGASARQILC